MKLLHNKIDLDVEKVKSRAQEVRRKSDISEHRNRA